MRDGGYNSAIGDIMQQLIKQAATPESRIWAAIYTNWQHIVQEEFAAMTSPVAVSRVRDGYKLTVATSPENVLYVQHAVEQFHESIRLHLGRNDIVSIAVKGEMEEVKKDNKPQKSLYAQDNGDAKRSKSNKNHKMEEPLVDDSELNDRLRSLFNAIQEHN